MSSRPRPPAESATGPGGSAGGPVGAAAGSPSLVPRISPWRRAGRKLRDAARAAVQFLRALQRHPAWRRLARWLLIAAGVAAALALALVLLVRFVVWPQAASAREWIEERGSAALSARLAIGSLTTSWDGWHPAFRAEGVRLLDSQQRVLMAADSLDGTLSWRTLTHFELRFARFAAARADVLVQRDRDGVLRVAGMPVNAKSGDDGDHRFLDWLLAQGRVDIHAGKVRWLDEQRGLPLLEVGDIRLQSRLAGARHQVRLEASSPALSAQPLVVTGSFRHTYLHAPGDWRNWHGQANWNLAALQLPALQRYTALVEHVASGTLSSDGTLEFADGRIARSQVRLRASDLDVRVQGAVEPLRLSSAQALLLHRREGADDQLTIDTLLWEPAGEQAQAAAGAWREGMRKVVVRWARYDDGSLRRFALKAPTLDLDAVRALSAAMPVDGEAARRLRAMQPSGRLDNLDLRWAREPAGLLQRQAGAPRYHVQGTLRQVSVREQPANPAVGTDGHARIGVPGFSGMSGNFQFDQRGGSARFSGNRATLAFPGVFEEQRLSFDDLSGQFSWRHVDGKLAVQSDGIQFANADAAGTIRGNWREGGDGHAGIADLRGELTRAQVARVPRYLPLVVPAGTRSYLAGALAGGESHGVTFSVQGDLAHFPFHGPNARHGDFHVDVPLRQASYQINPHPSPSGTGWPLFTDIDGNLRFDRGTMSLHVARAAVQGMPGLTLQDVRGQIDHLDHHGRLALEGAATGPTQAFLRYVAASPVGEWTGHFTRDSRAQGNGELRLKLDLPLADAHGAKVDGRFHLRGNDLVLLPGVPALGGTTGAVAFSERGFQLEGTRARWLGGEVRASGGTQPDGTIRVTATGTANARGMADALAAAGAGGLGARISGTTGYQATIGVREGQPTVSLASELNGLGIDVPAPLGKAPAQAQALRLDWKPSADRAGHAELELRYGDLAQARYLLRRAAAGMEVVSGGIGVGAGVGAPAPGSGVTATVAVDRLDVDAWRTALGTAATSASSSSPASAAASSAAPAAGAPSRAASNAMTSAFVPERVTARTRALRAFGRDLDDVTLDASRLPGRDKAGWQMRLESRQIAGQMRWQPDDDHDAGALTLRLSRLHLPESDDAGNVADALASRIDELPAIDLVADQFQLRGHDFGKLQIRAHTEQSDGEPVWTLQSLTLEQPGATFTGTGSWRVPRRMRSDAGAQRRTMLSFHVDIRNAGNVLDRLGLPHTLRDGKGQLEGRVRWAGSPLSIDYPSLAGRLSLHLENGQIARVEPGAAKLLGVLSLQSLMRIATLDFRSLGGGGLVFDAISATGTIENGIATTDDFRLKSPQVSATMKGSADISRETQDLQVSLVPRINATSASVAAAFVNPALGIGTLAAQLLFADEFSKAFTQHYHVTGSWADPQIVKVGDNRQQQGQPAPGQKQPEQSYMP